MVYCLSVFVGHKCPTFKLPERFSDDLHRPQFQQHLKSVIDIPLVWCFEEWECCHIAQFQRSHAQDDGGQVATDDFGVGELGAAVEIFF